MNIYPANIVDPQKELVQYEDFMGQWITATTQMNPWLITVTNGTVTNAAGPAVVGKYGVVLVAGLTAAGDFACIANRATDFFGPPGNMQLLFSHQQTQAAAALFSQRLGIALTPGAAGEVASGIFFRASGAGNWFAVTRNGGAETATDTGIAQKGAGIWTKFLITTNPAGTSATFSIDGQIVATNQATNMPAAGVLMAPFVKGDTTGVGSSESFGIDYIWMKISGLSR